MLFRSAQTAGKKPLHLVIAVTEGKGQLLKYKGYLETNFNVRCSVIGPQEQKDKLKKDKKNVETPFIGLTTPDRDYYVGLERASAIHAQSMLAYEMNGAPLTSGHGAPLRLVCPLKYGVKSIKRIGAIHFAHQRPADYWAERGYDWYLGH